MLSPFGDNWKPPIVSSVLQVFIPVEVIKTVHPVPWGIFKITGEVQTASYVPMGGSIILCLPNVTSVFFVQVVPIKIITNVKNALMNIINFLKGLCIVINVLWVGRLFVRERDVKNVQKGGIKTGLQTTILGAYS